MKKSILFIIMFFLVITLVSCGNNNYDGKCEFEDRVIAEYSYNDKEGFTYYKDDIVGEYSQRQLDILNSNFADYDSKVDGVHDFIDNLNDNLGRDVCVYSSD